jgi:cell division protein FtsI (penicillin-binding protein 3)
MSALVTERARTTARSATRTPTRTTGAVRAGGSRRRTATVPAQRGAPAVERGNAAGRAYAKRDDRLRRLVGGRTQRAAVPAGRAQFVLLVMGLLAVGLIVTLWLSTAAAADSYRLQDARDTARTLTEQSEQLRRQVTAMDSAPALAQRAGQLGMVPVQDSARLVVAPDGSVTLVGLPKAAIAAPVPAPAPVAAPAGPAAPTADAALESQPDATPGAGTPAAATTAGGTGAATGPAATGTAATRTAANSTAATGAGTSGAATSGNGSATTGTGTAGATSAAAATPHVAGAGTGTGAAGAASGSTPAATGATTTPAGATHAATPTHSATTHTTTAGGAG